MNDRRINDTESILNLQPLQVMVDNIDNLAEELYVLLGPHLLPNNSSNGIYLKATNRRLTHANEKYYTKAGLSSNTPITTLEGLAEDVLDSDGYVVIPKKYVLLGSEALVLGDTTVSRMTPFINACVNNLFNTCLKRYNSYNARAKYLSLLSPTAINIIDNDEIDVCCKSLLDKIDAFIGTDVWNIYFINFVGRSIFVNKSHDYRIYEWTKQNECTDEE